MYTWLLVSFIFTGEVLDGTLIEKYLTFKDCREALLNYQPTIPEEQVVCWPNKEKDDPNNHKKETHYVL